MLFQSSLRKELGRSFSATLVILLTVIVTMMLIRTLSLATRGRVNPSEVMLVMGYTVLGQLPIVLTLCLFIAIVGVLGRMYRDSEMVIWFSSGCSLGNFLPVLMRFAAPVLIAIGLLSTIVWPWANAQVQEMRANYEQRGDIERIAPGQFQESGDGNRVFYIDKNDVETLQGNNAFIFIRAENGESITSAHNAFLDSVDGEQMVILRNGQRIDVAHDGRMRISEFEQYGTRINASPHRNMGAASTKVLSTMELVRNPSPKNQAELAWRFSLLLASFNFLILALSITIVNPRAGRSGNTILALLAAIVYYNLINLGQSWIVRGIMNMGQFMLLLHGGIFVLAVLMLYKRSNRWSLRDLWRKRPAATPPSPAQIP